MNAIESINGKLQTNGQHHFGDTVFWTVRDVSVLPDELRNMMRQAGIDPDLVPSDLTPEQAFRRAVRKTSNTVNGGKKNGLVKYLIRQIHNSETSLAYAIVQEQRVTDPHDPDITLTVEHNTVGKIAIDKTTDTLSYSGGDGIVEQIVSQYYANLGTFSTEDLQKVLKNAMTAFDAVTLREHGGVYFVPASYADSIRSLQDVVNRTGDVTLGMLTLYEDDGSRATLEQAAQDDLNKQLNDLMLEIQSFGKSTRETTMERRVDALRALQDKAQYYSDLLGFAKTGIDQGVKDAEDHIRTLLLG